jgi:hypothetical protein
LRRLKSWIDGDDIKRPKKLIHTRKKGKRRVKVLGDPNKLYKCKVCKDYKHIEHFGVMNPDHWARMRVKKTCQECDSKSKRVVEWYRKNVELSISCGCCNKMGEPLVIDHDHETGAYRGDVCVACNTGFGNLGDNLAGVVRGAMYLCEFDSDALIKYVISKYGSHEFTR